MSRAAAMQKMDEAAAIGRLALQYCVPCGATQYPPRELCHVCLSAELDWAVAEDAGGEVLAATILHHSHEPAMRPRLPLRIGLVRLDAGPSAVCFIPTAPPGARVRLRAALDEQGRAIMTAKAET